jgi:hypothetical protein
MVVVTAIGSLGSIKIFTDIPVTAALLFFGGFKS